MGDGRGHRVSRSLLMKPPASTDTILHGHGRDLKLVLLEIIDKCRSTRPGKLPACLTEATCALGLISLFSAQDDVEQGYLKLMRLDEGIRYSLFECFRAFVVCPWWRRIWVVQEVAVGRTITIQYGTNRISWQAMVSAASTWSSPRTRLAAASAGLEPENLKVFTLFANQLNGLEQTRRKWHAEGGTELTRLLQEFLDRHATDDRDKVYGLLSLVKREHRYIEPNYRLDVLETYKATVLALINKGGSLACWAGDQKRKFNRGLPSWVPDWSTALDTGDKRSMDLFDSYTANGGWKVRVVESETEYWDTVMEQMDLLIRSPIAKARRLPGSLGPFVLEYIQLLEARHESLQKFTFDYGTDIPMYIDAWDSKHELPLDSAFEWCEKHQFLPHSGGGPPKWRISKCSPDNLGMETSAAIKRVLDRCRQLSSLCSKFRLHVYFGPGPLTCR
jgi:hypothetical protein